MKALMFCSDIVAKNEIQQKEFPIQFEIQRKIVSENRVSFTKTDWR